MKPSWTKTTLGETLAVIRNGVNCKQDKSGTGDMISRIESISDATFDLNKVGFAALRESDKTKNRLLKGDILFSHINSAVHVGKTAIFDSEGPVYHGVNLLLMRPNEFVTSAFLNYWLKALFWSGNWRGVCKQSVNQASVNQQDISRVEISYPISLTEQQRIVGILDEAFEGIATAKANAERNVVNARAFFGSHLESVFTNHAKEWAENRIEEWCDSVIDCVNKTAPVVDGPTPFKMLRTTNIRNGHVDHSTVRYVTEATYKMWTRRQIPQMHDVILTREAPMGEVGMLLTADKVFLGQRLVSYRAAPAKLDPQFLLFALQSRALQKQIHAKASGSTVQHMRVPDTKNLLLAAPPLPRQRELVKHIVSIQEKTQWLIAVYERKLVAVGALRKSLLHQAFTGQL